MRALGIVGSQRKNGQTDRLVRAVLARVGSAVAEYSNPHHLLEYLADFSTLLAWIGSRISGSATTAPSRRTRCSLLWSERTISQTPL